MEIEDFVLNIIMDIHSLLPVSSVNLQYTYYIYIGSILLQIFCQYFFDFRDASQVPGETDDDKEVENETPSQG